MTTARREQPGPGWDYPCLSTIISAALTAQRRRVSARFASPIHCRYSLRCDGGRASNILSAAAARASSIDVCRPIRTCPSCRPTTSTRPRWCLGRRGGGGTAIVCTLRALPNRGRQPGCCSSTGRAGTAGRCGPSPHWWPHAVSTSVPSTCLCTGARGLRFPQPCVMTPRSISSSTSSKPSATTAP